MPHKWKIAQNNNKVKSKTKLAVLVLLLLIGVLIISQLYKLYVSLQNSSWDGNSKINLVILSSSVSLISYSPKDKDLKIVIIPQETYLEVAHNFGKWKIGSIYNLGQSEKVPQGIELLSQSLSQFLGVPMDGYLKLRGFLHDKNALELITYLRQSQINFLNLKFSSNSSLNDWELYRLVTGVNSVRFDKIEEINLGKGYLKDSVLPDQTKVKLALPERIEILSGKLFADSAISDEQLSIAVFNATKIPGLAQKAARLISNSGGNVIIEKNAQTQNLKKSIVLTTISSKSYTFNRLKAIFAKNCPNCDIVDETVQKSRAQINVVLGEDFK